MTRSGSIRAGVLVVLGVPKGRWGGGQHFFGSHMKLISFGPCVSSIYSRDTCGFGGLPGLI